MGHINKTRRLSNQKGSVKLYNALRKVEFSLLSFEILEYSSKFIFKFKKNKS